MCLEAKFLLSKPDSSSLIFNHWTGTHTHTHTHTHTYARTPTQRNAVQYTWRCIHAQIQADLKVQLRNEKSDGDSENKKRQPSLLENFLRLTSLTGFAAEPTGFNMPVADGTANDKLCFQEKLHEVVHYLSPYWPLSLLPSHSPSLLFFLSLFFLIT